MVNEPLIRYALYQWGINEIPSGVQFIHERMNDQPLPTTSFCSFNTFSTSKVGNDERLYTYNEISDNFTEEISGGRSILVSVNFYNQNSFENIHQLQSSLQKQLTLDLLYNNGLSFISASTVRDLTEVVSSKWELRFQIDVNFYINSVYQSLLDRINQVPVDGLINDTITTTQLIG